MWLFEAGLFTATFALFLAHALVDEVHLQGICFVAPQLLLYLCGISITAKLRTAGTCCAMRGVGQGKLASRIKYISFDNAQDISGIFLIGVTLVVGDNPTLVAFTVLCCCWRWILYIDMCLKIKPTFCERTPIIDVRPRVPLLTVWVLFRFPCQDSDRLPG